MSIRRGATDVRTFALLGGTLGAGYLAKAPFFPLALVVLAVSAVLARRAGVPARRALVALLAFAMVAGPWVVALSVVRGRVTFGDSARYNYARFVNGTTQAVHWQGGPPGSGTPVHPSRKLLDAPAVYEFGTPLAGTYPPWTDPQYWYEGVVPHFDARQQLTRLTASARTYAIVLETMRWPVFGALVLLLVGARTPGAGRRVAGYGFLLVVAAAALGMYALVLVLPRYASPWVILLVVIAAAAAQRPRTRAGRLVAHGVVLAVPLLTLPPVGKAVAATAWRAARGERPPHRAWEVAEHLHQVGVTAPTRVGFVGRSFRFQWARLAGARVVAEVRPLATPDVDIFWAADAVRSARAMDAFARAGAVAVVADTVPDLARHPDWRPLGSTGYAVRLLTPRTATRAR
jgi:hypothetical protein